MHFYPLATSPADAAMTAADGLAATILRQQVGWAHWVITRLLDLAEPLSAAELDRTATVPHGTLRRTLFHLVSVDWEWGEALMHLREMPTLTLEEASEIAEMRARWQQYAAAFSDWLQTQDSTALAAPGVAIEWITDGREPVTAWIIVVHMCMHVMQHASEAAHLLTDVGHSPGDIDFAEYRVWQAQQPPQPPA